MKAQTPAYLHHSVSSGLPSNTVYCGIADEKGLIWIGTDKGLVFFDGVRFHNYGVEQGLLDPEIWKLQKGKNGKIWIADFSQQLSYLKNGRIFSFKNEPILQQFNKKVPLPYIEEDPKFGLLVYAGRYLFRKEKEVYRQFTLPDVPFTAVEYNQQKYLLCTAGIVVPTSDTSWTKILDFQEGLGTKIPFSSLAISGNRILYAFSDRLVLLEFNGNGFDRKAVLPGVSGRVYADFRGRFWVGTESEGVVCFDNTNRDFSNPTYYLPGKQINNIFEDTQGNMWFCSSGDGVYILPINAPLSFSMADKLPGDNITCLLPLGKGRLMLGDDKGNLTELQGGATKTLKLGALDGRNKIRKIMPFGNELFWVVTDEGLLLVDWANGTFKVKAIPTATKSITYAGGKIWVGTPGMTCYLSPDQNTPILVAKRRNTVLCADKQQFVWSGETDGLYSSADSFKMNWGTKFPQLATRVSGLQFQGRDSLWVIAPQYGLLLARVDNGRVLSVSNLKEMIRAPLPNIQSVFFEQMPEWHIWLGTNKGIYCIDKNWHVTNYDTRFGLTSDEVNEAVIQDGYLWVATPGGLTRMSLSASREQAGFVSLATGIHYTVDSNIQYVSLVYDSLKKVVLPPLAASVKIELSGLNFKNPGAYRYECVVTAGLLPFSHITLDNLLAFLSAKIFNTVNHVYLENSSWDQGLDFPAGAYQIKVTAISGNVMSAHPDQLEVVKMPFWYNTIWFGLALWLIAFYIGYRILRVYLALKDLKFSVTTLQLKALQSQINPHFVGNSINAIQQFFFPPDSARASTYISLFTRLLHQTLLFSEKNLITFREEVEYDKDYLEMIRLRLGERFQYVISGADSFPPDLIFPAITLQPILENATIHGLSPDGVSRLTLDFYLENNRYFCVITDNGLGINAVQLHRKRSGIKRESKGLEHIQMKIQTLNQLYPFNLRIAIVDLTEAGLGLRGTQITVSFNKITDTAIDHLKPRIRFFSKNIIK